MLAYVYGVVPISLCRSGGCGVSAGNGKGVRIEFDDENDMNVGSGAAATGGIFYTQLKLTVLLIHCSQYIYIHFYSLFSILCRYNLGCRDQEQPQYRGGQCWRVDRQPECQWKPHRPLRGHQRQPEWDSLHHGFGWSQYNRQPVRKCHGQLPKQVIKQGHQL